MSTLRRRKDLERKAPRALRKGKDKIRLFEDTATGEIMLLVGASSRSESELLRMAEDGMAMKRAADLLDAPGVGGVQ